MPRRSVNIGWVIVAIALALSLGAGASASAKPVQQLTTSQVKKLAGKVVAKRAATLTVAHASTADSLTGVATATLLDRIASGSNNTASAATVGTNEILPAVTITVPPGVSFVRVTGAADFSGTGTISVFVAPGGTPCASTTNDGALRPYLSLSTSRGQLTSDTVVPVAQVRSRSISAQTSIATRSSSIPAASSWRPWQVAPTAPPPPDPWPSYRQPRPVRCRGRAGSPAPGVPPRTGSSS